MNHLTSLDLLGAAELRAVGLDNPLRLLGLSPADLRPSSTVRFDPAALRFKESAFRNPQSAIDLPAGSLNPTLPVTGQRGPLAQLLYVRALAGRRRRL